MSLYLKVKLHQMHISKHYIQAMNYNITVYKFWRLAKTKGYEFHVVISFLHYSMRKEMAAYFLCTSNAKLQSCLDYPISKSVCIRILISSITIKFNDLLIHLCSSFGTVHLSISMANLNSSIVWWSESACKCFVENKIILKTELSM